MKREQNQTDTSGSGVRVKGGAQRKMLSRKRGTGVLPPLAQMSGGVSMTSFDAAALPRSTSPITYSYVQDKLNHPPSSLQSIKSVNKSVSFSASNSVRNIPHRSESICENYEEDDDEDDEDEDDDDEIGTMG
jgi:hypothetical protein